MEVAYLPFDEDSLGYVTMEAATAGKALITTTDSGGVLALVKHLQTGLVAEPEPHSLANILSEIWSNKAKAKEYGISASQLWSSFGINWHNTVEALLI